MSSFDILLVGHLLGDFLFQTNWMATNKAARWTPLIIHSIVYTGILALLSVLFTLELTLVELLIIFSSHVIIDRRGIPKLWVKWIMGVKENDNNWLFTVVDQIFHLLVLFGVLI